MEWDSPYVIAHLHTMEGEMEMDSPFFIGQLGEMGQEWYIRYRTRWYNGKRDGDRWAILYSTSWYCGGRDREGKSILYRASWYNGVGNGGVSPSFIGQLGTMEWKMARSGLFFIGQVGTMKGEMATGSLHSLLDNFLQWKERWREVFHS